MDLEDRGLVLLDAVLGAVRQLLVVLGPLGDVVAAGLEAAAQDERVHDAHDHVARLRRGRTFRHKLVLWARKYKYSCVHCPTICIFPSKTNESELSVVVGSRISGL